MNKLVLLMGPSGSGKGTQAKLLLEKFNFLFKEKSLYFETGKGFRNFIEENNHTARLTKQIIDDGGLLPEFLPIWLWTEFLVRNFTGSENLILDGFTRRVSEVPVFISAVKFYGIQKPVLLSLNVSREWAKHRLMDRGRVDDNVDDIERRLDWYFNQVIPAIKFFENDGTFDVYEINGEQEIDKVHSDISEVLGL